MMNKPTKSGHGNSVYSFYMALLGILPNVTVIHKNSLNLFMSKARNIYFIEFEVAERQLVMKGVKRRAGLT